MHIDPGDPLSAVVLKLERYDRNLNNMICFSIDDSVNANRSAKCQKILIVFSDGTIQNCKETFERRNPNKEIQVRHKDFVIKIG